MRAEPCLTAADAVCRRLQSSALLYAISSRTNSGSPECSLNRNSKMERLKSNPASMLFGLLADFWIVPLISSPIACSSYVLDAGLKMRYLKKAACSILVGIALGDPWLGDQGWTPYLL